MILNKYGCSLTLTNCKPYKFTILLFEIRIIRQQFRNLVNSKFVFTVCNRCLFIKVIVLFSDLQSMLKVINNGNKNFD